MKLDVPPKVRMVAGAILILVLVVNLFMVPLHVYTMGVFWLVVVAVLGLAYLLGMIRKDGNVKKK